jgi:hypothetical protein
MAILIMSVVLDDLFMVVRSSKSRASAKTYTRATEHNFHNKTNLLVMEQLVTRLKESGPVDINE